MMLHTIVKGRQGGLQVFPLESYHRIKAIGFEGEVAIWSRSQIDECLTTERVQRLALTKRKRGAIDMEALALEIFEYLDTDARKSVADIGGAVDETQANVTIALNMLRDRGEVALDRGWGWYRT